MLLDAAKKVNIALYRQRRPIELEDGIIKLNSKRMALEAQIQKQFIWNTDKQLNEEKIIDLSREMQTLNKEKRNSEENKVITGVTINL